MYKILSEETTFLLEQSVIRYMKDGYDTIGGITVVTGKYKCKTNYDLVLSKFQPETFIYSQAMKKVQPIIKKLKD
jgi:hypothetical protein